MCNVYAYPYKNISTHKNIFVCICPMPIGVSVARGFPIEKKIRG